MFENFTDRARKVMALANQEAQRLNHEYIGTEHILLGLIMERGSAAAVLLSRRGVDLARARREYEKLVKPGPDMVTIGRLPLTPRSKKLVEYADRTARDLKCNEVGTEHLLLAILQERDGMAAQLLCAMGLSLDQITEDVLREIGVTAESLQRYGIPLTGPRFTDRARRALELATEEARRLNHEYIGTEHILLGIFSEGTGVGANVLKNLGLTLPKLRSEVARITRAGEKTVTADRLPQTPRAKKVIQHAIEEESILHQDYVGTEHLLLGVLREQDSVACQVLTNLGLTPGEVREAVLKLLGSGLSPAPETTEIRDADAHERFSGLAGKVISMASQEAGRFNHDYIGTEHLLLAILDEGSGVAAKALQSFGVDLHKVLVEVEKVVKILPDKVTMSNLPQTPRAKKAIEHAAEESRSLRRRYLGTGDLLLGLMREEDGIAAQILMNQGLKLEELREAVIEFQGSVD